MSDIRDLYAKGLDAFSARVDGIADGWSKPTPCADWNVRQLVNHVAGENLWAPPLLEGKTIAEVGDQFDGDVLGDDPVAVWHASTKPALDAATAVPLDQTVHLSFGDFPAEEYLWQLTADLLIHGWDLARATGQSEDIRDDLVDACAAWFEPMEDAYRSAGAIGPRIEVPGGDPLAVLLGRFGRDPRT